MEHCRIEMHNGYPHRAYSTYGTLERTLRSASVEEYAVPRLSPRRSRHIADGLSEASRSTCVRAHVRACVRACAADSGAGRASHDRAALAAPQSTAAAHRPRDTLHHSATSEQHQRISVRDQSRRAKPSQARPGQAGSRPAH